MAPSSPAAVLPDAALADDAVGRRPARATPPSRLGRSRRYLELTTVLLGWLSWYLTWGYASFDVRKPGSALLHAGRTARSGVVGILVTFALFAAFHRLERRGYRRAVQAASAVGIGLLGAYVHSVATLTFTRLEFNDRPLFMAPIAYVGGAFAWYIVFAAFTLLYYLIASWTELQAERERAIRAATLAREARLQMLRYQLNPHFLFNALGTIRSILHEDVARAEKLVTQLSDFLRYTLVEEDRLEVTLGQELDTIQNYLSIQQMRFEEKLVTRIEADPAAREWTVPAFLVHPLVENAVKHGMRTSAMPLHVRVRASLEEGSLRVEVVNSGRLRSGAPGGHGAWDTGIGLKNVRMHLEHFFPDRHAFALEEREGQVHAILQIRPEHANDG